MIEELVMLGSRGDRDRPGLAALIMTSSFRDEVPWLYEMAAEAYRFSMVGNSEAERRAVRDFLQACDMATHVPFVREFLSRNALVTLGELPMMLGRFLDLRSEERSEPEE